jgi:hypothetical protein
MEINCSKNHIVKVLEHCHSSPKSGHFGVRKTTSKIAQFYYWQCMDRDIRKFVQKCRTCQKYKPQQSLPMGKMKPVELLRPFKIMASDFIGPLPRSPKGYKYILLFLDLCTRYPIAVPLKSATAKNLSLALYKQVILQCGAPEIILTDSGTQ